MNKKKQKYSVWYFIIFSFIILPSFIFAEKNFITNDNFAKISNYEFDVKNPEKFTNILDALFFIYEGNITNRNILSANENRENKWYEKYFFDASLRNCIKKDEIDFHFMNNYLKKNKLIEKFLCVIQDENRENIFVKGAKICKKDLEFLPMEIYLDNKIKKADLKVYLDNGNLVEIKKKEFFYNKNNEFVLKIFIKKNLVKNGYFFIKIIPDSDFKENSFMFFVDKQEKKINEVSNHRVDVNGKLQKYGLSCEVASLVMVLKYFGVNIDEDTIINRDDFFDHKGRLGETWGNPQKGFVGNIDGFMSTYKQNMTGYGVFWKPIAKIAKDYKNNSFYFENKNIKFLSEQISKNRLVILWTSLNPTLNDFSSKKIEWKTANGEKIVAPLYEHTLVLTGFVGNSNNPKYFLFIDPDKKGEWKWSSEKIARVSQQFNFSGVVVF